MKKLREFILELAVRGKLVSQLPAEIPARESLAALRIKPSKNKVKPMNNGWDWASLNDVGDFFGGMTPSKGNRAYWGSGVPWVSPKDMKSPQIEAAEDEITSLALNETTLKIAPPKSLLMVTRSGILKRKFPVSINSIECVVNQDLKVLVPKDTGMSRYLQLMLHGFQKRVLTEFVKSGMTVQSITFKEFSLALWPIPPLAEQSRILAKVDELMGLCDALEREAKDSHEAHQTLVKTCLATLTNSQTSEELNQNWTRLETHFDTLFSTEESIKSLHEAVLEWAVLGLLSERLASDTSPNSFLIRNGAARKEQYFQTKDARLKKCADVLKDEYTAKLPENWSLASFDELFLFIDYRGRTPKKTEDGTPLITAKNVRMGVLNREPREFVSDQTYSEWMTRGFPKIGDLFFTTEAPLANICINDIEEPFAIAQRVICFQPISELNTKFLEIAIRSRPVQKMIDRNGTGMTAKGIKASKLKPLPLPVPPSEEQERIVSKVDELLNLCQALLKALPEANKIATNLADTLTTQIH